MTADPTTATPPAPGPRRGFLRVGLALLAATELIGALNDLPAIFSEYGEQTGLLKFAQAVTSVKIALAPLIAGAALVLAAIGRLPAAIVALAALMLVVWLSELPSIPIHGFEVSANLSGAFIFVTLFVYPALAAAAIWLARRNQRLALATLLVGIPLLLRILSVVAFAIGIAIYGF